MAGNGIIYVVNRSYEFRPDGKRITVCTTEEEYLSEFGYGLSANVASGGHAPDGSLMWPTSIALDQVGNVYVADEWLNRISIFTKDGQWVSKWGTPGSRDGEIDHPSGLTFDADDNLLIVDSRNHRIQKFTKDGKFLSQWGSSGSGSGELSYPWGICLDNEGNVYVVDWNNNRVQKFTSDGKFLMQIGNSCSVSQPLNQPSSVAVDRDGLIYVADWGNDLVQIFGPDGLYITTLTGDGSVSKWGKESLDASPQFWHARDLAYDLEREKRFWGPISVAVDSDGRLLIVESARHRIQVYRKQSSIFYGSHL